MKQQTLTDIPLGQTWTQDNLKAAFQVVWGGLAYPGKRPGFALVAGLRRQNESEVHVLDEYESTDLGDLLRRCRSLGEKYRVNYGLPEFLWWGDNQLTSALPLMREIGFDYPRHSPILDMEQPYSYMMAKLHEYLNRVNKQLVLRGSKVAVTLTDIKPEDVSYLEFGAYPDVEALAFVVTALRNHGPTAVMRLYDRRQPRKNNRPLSGWLE
jgi:hypothetical protein